MAELVFKVEADYEKVRKLREEIDLLEKQLKSIDVNVNPEAAKTLQESLGKSKDELRGLSEAAAVAAAEIDSKFKREIYESANASNDLTQKIIEQRRVVGDHVAEVKSLSTAYNNMAKQSKDAAGLSELKIQLDAARASLEKERNVLKTLQLDKSEATLATKRLRDEYTLYKRDAEVVVNVNESLGSSFKTLLGVVGGTAAIKKLLTDVVKVRSEFQNIEASFKVFLGSAEQARDFVKEIQGYAYNNVFEFKELTQQAQQLLAYGNEMKDVVGIIDQLSSVAAGANRPLAEMVELFNKAKSQGHLYKNDILQWQRAGVPVIEELANQFGIAQDEVWGLVKAGKVGFTEIQQIIANLTSEGGKFFGIMEERMKGLGDSVGLLQDTVTNVLNEIGQNTEDFLRGAILTVNTLVENYKTIGKILAGIITVYGTYRAALVTVNLIESARTIGILKTVAATKAAIAAQTAFNAVSKLNPYAALGAAVAGTAYALWSYSNAVTSAGKAQDEFNKSQQAFNNEQENRKNKIRELIRIVQDETETSARQQRAYNELSRILPSLTSKYDLLTLKTLNLNEAQKLINISFEQANYSNLVDQAEKYKERIAQLQQQTESIKNSIYQTPGQVAALSAINKDLEVTQEALKIVTIEISNFDKAKKEALLTPGKKIELAKIDEEEARKEFQRAKDLLEEEESKLQNQFGTINIAFRLQYEGARVNLEAKEAIVAELEKTNKAQNVQENQNKAYWEKLKKDAEGARDALSIDEVNKEKWKELTEIIRNASEQLEKYNNPDTGKKAQAALQKRLDAAVKLAEKEKQVERDKVNFTLEMRQKEINLLDDSFNKQYQQNQQNYDKDIESLKDYTQKRIKEQQELEKLKWEASGKVGTFTPSTTEASQLPQEVQDQIQAYADAYRDAYVKNFEDITNAEKEALDVARREFISDKDRRLQETNKYYAEELKKAQGNIKLIQQLEKNRTIETSRIESEFRQQAIQREQDYATRRIALLNKMYLFESTREAEVLAIKLRAAQELREEIQKQYDLTPTDELYNELVEIDLVIKEIGNDIEKIPTKKIIEAFDAIKNISQEFASFGGEFGSFFSGLGSQISNVSVAFDEGASGFDKISAGVSGLVSLIGVVSGASARRKQAEKDFYKNAIAFAHEYSLALNEQIRLQSEITGSGFITDYAGKIKDGFEALTDATYNYQEALSKLSEGKAKIDLRNAVDWGSVGKGAASGAAVGAAVGSSVVPVIGTAIGAAVGAVAGFFTGLFGGKKKKNQYGGLLDIFPELVDGTGNLNKELAQSLISTNQLDDKTKQLVQNALEWADAVEEAEQQIRDVVVELAGDVGNKLKNSLIDAWKAGEDASKAMFEAASESLEKFVEDLVYSAFFADVFKQFEDDLVSAVGGEGDVVAAFEDLVNSFMEREEAYIGTLSTLQDYATEKGFELWKKEQYSQTATSRGFQTISQDSADELNGRFTALQMAGEEIKRNNYDQTLLLTSMDNSLNSILSVDQEIYNVADETRTMIANSYLELQEININTFNTVKGIKEISSKVDKVIKNQQ